MAMQMVSPNVQRKANELLERSDKWATGSRKRDGLAFIVFASQSTPGVYYYTGMSGDFCTCPAARLSRSGMCCHRVAAAAAQREAQEQPYRTYRDLFGADEMLESPY